MTRSIDGAVLLGGASSRMGRDKSRVLVGGLSCLERVTDALSSVCDTIYLVGGEPPEVVRGHRIPDPPGPRCALRGLAAALDAARSPQVLVLATDLPLVTPTLLQALAEAPPAGAWVPRDADGAHPLCARYAREPALAAARARLDGDALALRGVLEALDTRYLEGEALREVDPDARALWNVNAPEDLARAEAWLAERAAP